MALYEVFSGSRYFEAKSSLGPESVWSEPLMDIENYRESPRAVVPGVFRTYQRAGDAIAVGQTPAPDSTASLIGCLKVRPPRCGARSTGGNVSQFQRVEQRVPRYA